MSMCTVLVGKLYSHVYRTRTVECSRLEYSYRARGSARRSARGGRVLQRGRFGRAREEAHRRLRDARRSRAPPPTLTPTPTLLSSPLISCPLPQLLRCDSCTCAARTVCYFTCLFLSFSLLPAARWASRTCTACCSAARRSSHSSCPPCPTAGSSSRYPTCMYCKVLCCALELLTLAGFALHDES